jgi:hypothetical protein
LPREKTFERGIFDGGDPEFSRFTVKDYEIRESARLKSRAALRIPFPMLDLGFPKLSELQKAPPIYEIHPWRFGRKQRSATSADAFQE